MNDAGKFLMTTFAATCFVLKFWFMYLIARYYILHMPWTCLLLPPGYARSL